MARNNSYRHKKNISKGLPLAAKDQFPQCNVYELYFQSFLFHKFQLHGFCTCNPSVLSISRLPSPVDLQFHSTDMPMKTKNDDRAFMDMPKHTNTDHLRRRPIAAYLYTACIVITSLLCFHGSVLRWPSRLSLRNKISRTYLMRMCIGMQVIFGFSGQKKKNTIWKKIFIFSELGAGGF